MPSTNGFVKLNRSIMNCEWYGDIKVRGLFVHLLLSACWEDKLGADIARGQLRTTLRELSENSGLSIKETRTALERLKASGEITVCSKSHSTIITILNYGENPKTSAEQPKGTTSGTKKDTTSGTIKGTTFSLENGSTMPNIEGERSERGTTKGTTSGTIKGTTSGKPTLLNKEDIRRVEEAEEGGAAVSDILKEAVFEYNEICKSLEPFTAELNYYQARFVVEAHKALHCISFAEYFKRVEASDFLTGKGAKNFKADFNWLIRPENVSKVLSGKYDKSFSGTQSEKPVKKNYRAPLFE
ncbi:MAG: hypothetical protein ACI4JT_09865 [Oscillospiraceae bacterium]